MSTIPRRDFLFGLGSSLGALALTDLWAAEQKPVGPLAPKKPMHEPKAKAVIMLFMEGGPSQADTFDPKAREGITHYNRKEFDRATTKFQASQLEQPDNSDVSYNLANSLYRLGRYEEAVETYKKALGEKTSPSLKQKSYYNMGNAYYRMGYLEESIDAYKKALKLLMQSLEKLPEEGVILEHIGDVYKELGKSMTTKTFYERAVKGKEFQVEYFGETYPVELAGVGYEPLYDPENIKPRT